MFNFNPQKVKYDQKLGTGVSGAVYPYQKSDDDLRWVVKHIQTPKSETLVAQIQEIVLGFSCNHPNVLPVKGFHIGLDHLKTMWEIYIKMPRMEGTLRSKMNDHIADNTQFSEEQIVKYFYDVVCGLEYLHKKKIAHRDIKLDNILIDNNNVAKVSDIGIGKFIDEDTTHVEVDRAGTLFYSAPEVLDKNFQLKKRDLYKADTWSLGVVIAELCLLKSKIVKVFSSGEDKEKDLAKQIEELRGKYSDALLELLLSLLKWNPEERKTVEDAKKVLKENYGDLLAGKGKNENDVKEEETPHEEEEEKKEQQKNENEDKDKQTEGEEEKKEQIQAQVQVKEERVEAVKKELDKMWSHLFEILAYEKNSLTVKAIAPEKINDENVKCLFKDINAEIKEKNVKNLKAFTVRLNKCANITDDAFKDLISHLGTNHITPQELTLNLTECTNLTGNSMKELSTYIGVNQTDLKYLLVNLQGCAKMSDDGIKELSSQLGSKLVNLKFLHLFFNGCEEITDDAITELAKQIGENLKNLTVLKLRLENCKKITDASVKELSSQIGTGLQDITRLALDFTSCNNLTDDTVKHLIQQIAPNLKKLQSFDLSLTNCSKITDVSVKELALQIGSNLTGLQDLMLYFINCAKLTDNSVIELVNQIGPNLINLKLLLLELANCPKITDKTLKELTRQIGANLKQIQRLELYFGRCVSLSSAAVQELVKQISFRQLYYLTLSFNWCTKISSDAVKDIAKQIGTNMKTLKTLRLDLQGLNIKDKMKTLTKDELKDIPDVVVSY